MRVPDGAVNVISEATLVSIVMSLAADIAFISTTPDPVLYTIYMPFRCGLES